jgi:molybdenum cofactor guanylyltransferase
MQAGAEVACGIFVGGQAKRMGGRTKGLLSTPEGISIVAKLRAACDAVGGRVILVGGAASREPYAGEGVQGLDDEPRAEGPLAGLVALLANAKEGRAIALACDMPFVTGALLRRLIDDPSAAPVLAARRGNTWEPFFARYDAAKVLPLALTAARNGKLGLQSLLDEAGADAFAMSADEERALTDWDTPADVGGSR